MPEWIKVSDSWHVASGVILDGHRFTTCGKRTRATRQTLQLPAGGEPDGRLCIECKEPLELSACGPPEGPEIKHDPGVVLREDPLGYRVGWFTRYEAESEETGVSEVIQLLIDGGADVALFRAEFPNGRRVTVRYGGEVEIED